MCHSVGQRYAFVIKVSHQEILAIALDPIALVTTVADTLSIKTLSLRMAFLTIAQQVHFR